MAASSDSPYTPKTLSTGPSSSHNRDSSQRRWLAQASRLTRHHSSPGRLVRRQHLNPLSQGFVPGNNRVAARSNPRPSSAHGSIAEHAEPPLQPVHEPGRMLSVPQIKSPLGRPRSHPSSRRARSLSDGDITEPSVEAPPGTNQVVDPWQLPPLRSNRSSPPSLLVPKPCATISRLSSLDNVLTYHEEKAEWKRTSSLLHNGLSFSDVQATHGPKLGEDDLPPNKVTVTITGADDSSEPFSIVSVPSADTPRPATPELLISTTATEVASINDDMGHHGAKFRHPIAQVGFVIAISLMQLLSEYLISGFAIELGNLFSQDQSSTGDMGTFWPATLLSLVLSATLLIFARLSDRYGGYPLFMFGTTWLLIWTLIPGFSRNMIVVDVARAMQGLACASFVPSTFSMLGAIYPDGGRQRNIVVGLYSACAPLGFFLGFLASGLLPDDKPEWYFWIASIVSFIALVSAYLAVPHDRTDRRRLDLEMDWLGAIFVTSGLILVAYALAQYPYATRAQRDGNAFLQAGVLGPFLSGLSCLAFSVWVEGWYATSPPLPFDFFEPQGVLAFSFAGLCFYATYGVWLYISAELFQNTGVHGSQLALWYVPMAAGGLFLAIASGYMIDRISVIIMLLFSALAWIAAPLLLALSPLPTPYWSFVLPSMICTTAGIDLTYIISLIFFSAVQPKKYQGLAGAVCSILVNLAMSFSLSISEIVSTRTAQQGFGQASNRLEQENAGLQTSLLYVTASAGLGFLVCFLFVRISRGTLSSASRDEENRSRPTSSEAPTLVGFGEQQRPAGSCMELHWCK